MHRRYTWLFAVLLGLGYAFVIGSHARGIAGGSDASGYFNSARLIAAGKTSLPARPLPGIDPAEYPRELTVPLGFRPAEQPSALIPTYPPGLPLHIALLAPLTGWEAAGAVVNTLAAVAAFFLVIAVAASLGISPWWGLAAAVVFAANPVSMHFYTWLMSDGLTTTWTLAAMAAALAARRRAGWAVVAGAAVGVAVLIRITGILILPAVLLALPLRRRAWLALVGGGVPAAAFLAAYNTLTYDSIVATGYVGHGSMFAWQHVAPTLGHYLHWLGVFLSPLLVVAWLGVLVLAMSGDRVARLMAVWALPMLVLYAAYPHTRETWWYLRFILPALPALILGALWVPQRLVQPWLERVSPPRLRRAVPVLLAVATVVWPVAASIRFADKQAVLNIAGGDGEYPRAIAWMELQVPDGVPILCMQLSGAMVAYSERPILRYDTTDPAQLHSVVSALLENGVEPHALLFEFEVESFLARSREPWVQVGTSGRASLWRPGQG